MLRVSDFTLSVAACKLCTIVLLIVDIHLLRSDRVNCLLKQLAVTTYVHTYMLPLPTILQTSILVLLTLLFFALCRVSLFGSEHQFSPLSCYVTDLWVTPF